MSGSAAGSWRLAFDGVTFRYRRSGPDVLSDLSWVVPPGRTVLLGPNGAGKTTLLAIGANALRPQRGRVIAGSLDPSKRGDRRQFRKLVGWMPQTVRAVHGLTCREQVAYAAWLKGLGRREAWHEALDALRQVALGEEVGRLTSQLSGGQLRRVGLAQALVHRSKVLLLDEPTAGLDPAQRARFREIVAGIPADGPIVVSTHQVDDLTELFDTVTVIDRGSIRYEGPVSRFLELAPPGADRPGEAAYASLVSGEG